MACEKGKHKRDVEGMLSSRRCGAKTRSLEPCRAPAVMGKARCRMHGGAIRSGAPDRNQNALKHGLYTSKMLDHRRAVNTILGQSRVVISSLDDT